MFLKFILAWVRARWWKFRGWEVVAPQAVQMDRFLSCAGCKHFLDGACQICQCLVVSKTLLASEKCPLDRWGRVKLTRGSIISTVTKTNGKF